MHYKTIVLELLNRRQNRIALSTLDHWATELRASHQAVMATLRTANPGLSQEQIASDALELAIKNLEDSLPPASSDRHTEGDPSPTA